MGEQTNKTSAPYLRNRVRKAKKKLFDWMVARSKIVVVLGIIGFLVWVWTAKMGGTKGEILQRREAETGLAVVVVDCEALDERLIERGERGLAIVWDAGGKGCKKRRLERIGFKDVNVFSGPSLLGLWKHVVLLMDDQVSHVIVVDDSVTAPLSAFVANIVVPITGPRLSFRVSSAKMPRALSVKEDEARVRRMKQSFSKLPALITSIKEEGYMQEAGWGYHPERMEPRWRAIWRSLAMDGLHGNPKKAMMMVDWGSNEGYFSVKLGGFFRESSVFSVEAEVDEYRGVREKHRQSAAREGVSNNVLCAHATSGKEFANLAKLGVWDIQLSLSVMHWFTYTSHESFLSHLGWLLLGARTTFLELPEARRYGPNTGQTRAESLNVWYGGITDEVVLVERAIAHVSGKEKGIRFMISNLGPMFHQTGTVRTLLRVDVKRPSAASLAKDDIESVLECGTTN